MNVRYRREGNKSYLIIAATKEQDYQIRMIQENSVSGLLATDIRRLNGEEEFYYDITGRQSLSNLFAKRQMSYEDIKGVLISVYSLTEELRRYLVEVNRVIFDAEYCFYNPDTGMAEWIFYERNERGECDFGALAEFILEHTDHDDKRGVEIGYKFYKLVREANFSMEQMVAYIDELYPAVSQEKKEEYEEPVFHMPIIPEVAESYAPVKESHGGILENALGRCKEFVGGKLQLGKKKEKDIPRMDIPELQPVFHMPEYPGEGVTQTELIIPVKKQAIRRFRRLGRNEFIDIPSVLPCIIGKDKKGADIVIDSSTISRVHARLYAQGSNILLQDLNSKNGTFKNGIQLDVHESVILQEGDEICFANLQYICE